MLPFAFRRHLRGQARQHAVMARRDELRQQRQVHDGAPGIGMAGGQAHQKQLARAVGERAGVSLTLAPQSKKARDSTSSFVIFILKRPTPATASREATLISQNRRNNRAAKHSLPGIDATL